MEIVFASSNKAKIEEVRAFFEDKGISIIPYVTKIEELQSLDENLLVRDKLLKVFKKTLRPIFVDHTFLEIPALGGLPSGLTGKFWEALGNEGFSSLIRSIDSDKVVAKTIIGYCDGKKTHLFSGEVEGKLTDSPKVETFFQWDSHFIPAGYEFSFAEMGVEKLQISMRLKALKKFLKFLEDESRID